ncbi:DUF4147 domain-containing protein [bacterium]|nr:MAG: DUF4147 domain-containing protein [bacterium]
MVFDNFTQLATSTERKQVLRILEAGLNAIHPVNLMKANFAYHPKEDALYINRRPISLKPFNRVVVVGAGKLAGPVAEQIEQQMLSRINGGVIIDIVEANLSKIVSRIGTHPLPSSANVSATEEIITMLNNVTERDLVIAIIGGGGSSLLCSPESVTLDEERKIFTALTEAGASIKETNIVRKHMSRVKGGGLAEIAYPATVISLIFSDVPGDDKSLVASGPTVYDQTTVSDAMDILNKYQILDRCKMDSCGLVETPKDKKYFEKVNNILFCSNKVALQAMADKAADLGLRPKIWSTEFTGEASELASQIVNSVKRGECLIAGGESVVTLQKHSSGKPSVTGSGGRNQEMALAALLAMKEDTVFASLASDGRDNSDVAGGLVDRNNLEMAKRLRIDLQDHLNRHDEYTVLSDINASILTGITGSNVSDLVVCLKY